MTKSYKFPAPIAEYIWDMKYRLKSRDGTVKDVNVDDTWRRIAKALAAAETDKNKWEEVFFEALTDFKFLPAGRITSGAGTGRHVTLLNCYVNGTIHDSMSGIFDALKDAALTMQQGGGIGYDFSTIRPASSEVKGVEADASGPLSFMDVWDSMCRTIMSAGSRRGAMMATLRCDHPDVEAFIVAKKDKTRLRMFNLSVLVTNDFANAVKNDLDWDLVFGGKVYKTVRAKELWELIMDTTYHHAEPGVIFIDRINENNNLNYCEVISATNPCGEQPLPPYGACLLGSMNLVTFVTPEGKFDFDEFMRVVRVAVRMMDNTIDVSNFPLPQQRIEAETKRRIGLGITGLADALIMMKITYGSDEAIEFTDKVMETLSHTAYRQSIELAKEKGAFKMLDTDKYLEAPHIKKMPEDIRQGVREHGIRNALLTSIAPTGTISLYAGNVSSGIEPVFAFEYTRKVLQNDGSHIVYDVEDFAIADFYRKNGRNAKKPEYFITAETLTPDAHLRMQAAAQKHVDSAISKTINCPEDISVSDFADIYMKAWDYGCKGCTTYRPNFTTGSILEVKSDDAQNKDESGGEVLEVCTFDPLTGSKTCAG